MAHILVMDDDPNVRRVLSRMLERAGHDVTLAVDGVEGLRLFTEGAFDLVITDIIMPRREGLETIVEIRRQKKGVPIIAMTGYVGRPYLDAAARLGACEVLFKPYDHHQLMDAVDRALGPSSDYADARVETGVPPERPE